MRKQRRLPRRYCWANGTGGNPEDSGTDSSGCEADHDAYRDSRTNDGYGNYGNSGNYGGYESWLRLVADSSYKKGYGCGDGWGLGSIAATGTGAPRDPSSATQKSASASKKEATK